MGGAQERTISADELDQRRIVPIPRCENNGQGQALTQNGEEGTSPVGEDRHEGESGLSPGEQWMERSYTATYLPLLPRVKANFPTKVGWNVRQNSCSIQSLPVGTQLPRNQPGTLS